MLKRITITWFIALSMLISASALTSTQARIRKPYLLDAHLAVPIFQDNLAIIVNKSNPIDNLSSIELRKIFMGERKTWSNGKRVTIVMRDEGQPEREAVLKAIYHMRDRDFNNYFMHAAFTGDATEAPKTLSSASGMLKFVFNVPGAIGYARVGEVNDTVKVIRIDGMLPTDAGYKIKCD
ncbi:MAG TPA: substrate-binding domain-containing protein [Blastocatellia bacterium]|nr:substrate-binding domain-containing protein [Blastocatellia bacterium]